MKKVLTLFAAVALLVSASFAQDVRRHVPMTKHERTVKVTPTAQLVQAQAKTLNVKAAGDTVATFPWIADFEAGTAPVGFTFIDADGDGYNWDYTFLYNNSTPAGHDGSLGLIASASYINNVGPLTPDNWMVLPSFTLPAVATGFELSWYEKGQDASYCAENYSVYVSTSGRTAADFGTTAVLTSTATGAWVKKTVDLSSYAGQTINIAFRHHNTTDMYYLDIDDIRVGGPSTPEVSIAGPTMVQVNTPATYVATGATTFSWIVDGNLQSATGDSLTYTFTSTGNNHQVIASATNTVGTSYDTLNVTVFSCEEAIEDFPWNEGFEGLTDCWEIIDFDTVYDGGFILNGDGYGHNESDFCLIGTYSDSIDVDQWAISPLLTIPVDSTGFILKYYVKMNDWEGVQTHYQVLVTTESEPDTSDFTLLWDETGVSDDYVPRTIALGAYDGQTIRIAFRNITAQTGDAMFIDDIYIGSAVAPELTLSGASRVRTNETYTYTASSDANTFAWTVDGNPLTATTASIDQVFTTVGPHTVTVTATNAANLSATETINITAIECATQTLPFESNFDADTVIGFCWDNINEGWNLGQLQNGTTVAYSIAAYSYYGYLIPLDPDNWLVTPMLTMPETGAYQVEYTIIGFNDYYTLYLIQGTDTTALFSEQLPDMEAFEPRVVLIPSTVTGDFKIAIRHYNSEDGEQLLLANLDVKVQGAPVVMMNGPAEVEKGRPATFTAVSGNADSFTWTVDGAQQTATGNTLTYTFTSVGNHVVTVTGTNTHGTSQPVSQTVRVYSCDEPLLPLPWTESFEGNVDCWIFTADDDYGFAVNGNYPNLAADGSNFLIGWTPTDANANQWAISMPFYLPANVTNAKLTWSVASNHQTATSINYEVLVSTQGVNPDYFTTSLFSETASTGNANVNREVSLASLAGKEFRIAFHNKTAAGGAYMILDNLKIASPTGIDNTSNINVAIYPNPVNDKLNIEGEGIQMVEMFDVNGRNVLTTLQAGQIDLSSLANGVYVVRVTAAEGICTEKIVKK